MGNLIPPSAAHSKANTGDSSAGNHPPLPRSDEETPSTTANQGLAPRPGARVPTGMSPCARLPNPTNGPAPPDSPAEDHDEVHDIPAVAQVRALVENEPQSHDLNPSLKAENPDEVGLCLLLPEGNR